MTDLTIILRLTLIAVWLVIISMTFGSVTRLMKGRAQSMDVIWAAFAAMGVINVVAALRRLFADDSMSLQIGLQIFSILLGIKIVAVMRAFGGRT